MINAPKWCLDNDSRTKVEIPPVILIVQIEWLECRANAMFRERKKYDLGTKERNGWPRISMILDSPLPKQKISFARNNF